MSTKKYISLEKLGLYDAKIKKVITDGDAATLTAANAYADGLADNYDAAGSATTAEANAKSYTDGQIATVNETVAGVKTTAEKGVNDAAAAQSAADAAQGDVDALENYVGVIPEDATSTNVVAYVQEKTSGIATESAMNALGNRVTTVEGKVATIEEDYLKTADKTELQNKINAKADQSALDAVSDVANAAVKQSDYNVKVAALEAEDSRIAGLIAAETQRSTGIEEDFESRISEMETFWEAADDPEGTIDKLAEIVNYIAADKSGAIDMAGDIADNTKAINEMDAAYKAADATLQSNIDKKADASVVDGIAGRVGDLETASAKHALKTEVQAVSDALSDYQEAHAGDYTNAQIDAAIKVNTDAIAKLNDTYATDAELTAAMEAEVTRANGAYAVKGLETTVEQHKADTVAHTTSAEKALWNAALQASDIATGTANGAIKVKGTDVAVKGLGSAAFVDATTFDAAGAASAVQGELTKEVDRAKAAEEALGKRIDEFVECSEEDINGLFA